MTLSSKRSVQAHSPFALLAWVASFGCVCFAALPLATASQPADTAPTLVNTPRNSYEFLAKQINEKIQELNWGEGSVLAAVADLEHGITIYERNAERTTAPGDLAKLFLAAAALDRLGPDFRFTTELQMSGQVVKHKPVGSLRVRGSGDPSMRGADEVALYATFDHWAKILRDLGVHSSESPVILDVSAFDGERLGPSWPIDRLGEPTLPEIDALNFNGNCVSIQWHAGKKDKEIAEWTMVPSLPEFVRLSNNVRLKAHPIIEREYRRTLDSGVIRVKGDLPLKIAVVESAGVHAPAQFFGWALRARFEEKGIKLGGPLNVVGGEAASKIDSAGFQTLDIAHSPPLSDIIKDMLHENRNLEAEAILKTMGHRVSGEPGSFKNGSAAVMTSLTDLNRNSSGMVLLDGSGLSTLDRATPRHVLELMRIARARPWRAAFEAAFPQAGMPGALEKRFAPDPGAAPVGAAMIFALPAKFAGGQAIAGWALSRSGHPINFVFIAAGSKLPDPVLERQLDALALELTRSSID